jgi:hypothetical protein
LACRCEDYDLVPVADQEYLEYWDDESQHVEHVSCETDLLESEGYIVVHRHFEDLTVELQDPKWWSSVIDGQAWRYLIVSPLPLPEVCMLSEEEKSQDLYGLDLSRPPYVEQYW